MKTTLNEIHDHILRNSCWGELLRHLGKTQADDEPLRIAEIVESIGLDDALFCLGAVGGYDREIRLFAVWCARQVQHLIKDPRSLNALDVAERYANGRATIDELYDASMAALDAMDVAYDEPAAARAVVFASALEPASYNGDAAWFSALEAMDAASFDASDAVLDAARAAQKAELLRLCAEAEAQESA